MEITLRLNLNDRQSWRDWLTQNHNTQKECWLSVTRGKTNNGVLYLDAVEEALCFGWIDSTTKSENGTTYQRFSPRRKSSHWTELNKERVRRLERQGQMTDAGRATLPADFNTPFQIDSDILAALQSDHIVWHNFQAFPPLYQRVHIGNIQTLRHRKQDHTTRLNTFIEKTRQNILFGNWHDNGRLL